MIWRWLIKILAWCRSQIWGGNPAKFLRKLTADEIAFIPQSATNYAELAQAHATENAKDFDKVEFEKVLSKKFANKDEEYGSILGAVGEAAPEILHENIKGPKAS